MSPTILLPYQYTLFSLIKKNFLTHGTEKFGDTKGLKFVSLHKLNETLKSAP